MGPAGGNGSSYEHSFSLWPGARALSHRARVRRQQRTSSARRRREPLGRRLEQLVEDALWAVVKKSATLRSSLAPLLAATPTFRRAAAYTVSLVKRFCLRKVAGGRLGFLIRNQPGLAAWCFVFLALAIGISATDRQPAMETGEATSREAYLRVRGNEAVWKTLATIGHGVEIGTVEVKPLEDGVLAHYRPWEKAIAFNSDAMFSETELLATAGHECVHAIFHQADLRPFPPDNPQRFLLMNETVAYVLGAHIAGRVWSRGGFDGDGLTERLVKEHRDACDSSMPSSVPRMIMESQTLTGTSWLSPEAEWGLVTHFGSPKIVDEMHRICLLHYEPWDAAHEIAKRFMTIDAAADTARATVNNWLPPRVREASTRESRERSVK